MFRFAICFSLGLAPAVCAADWPQFLGPARDGHSSETGLNWDWPKGGPKVAWKLAVGHGWASPVVSGGGLVLFHRVDDDEVVACLDAVTGKEKWKFKYPTKYRDDFNFDDGPRATPTVADGAIYTLGADGDLTALALATGQKLWARNLMTDYRPAKGFFGVACSPLVRDKKLYVNVGARGAGVVCFDAATGKELWKSTDDGASYSSPTIGTFDGKPAVVFLTRTGLRVLDPASGKSLYDFPWRPRDSNSVQAATPLVWKDEVFVTVSYSTGGALVQLKGGTAEEVWSNDKSLSSQYNTPVRVGDHLYGTHGRRRPALRRLENGHREVERAQVRRRGGSRRRRRRARADRERRVGPLRRDARRVQGARPCGPAHARHAPAAGARERAALRTRQ